MKKEIVLIVYAILGLIFAMLLVKFFPIGSKMKCVEGFTSAPSTKCIFNAKKYADMYPDLKKAFGYDEAKLKQHYLKYGMQEGRSPCGEKAPSCSWSPYEYLKANPAVIDIAIRNKWNPIQVAIDHYKGYGINMGLSPCPSIAVRKFGTCPGGSKVFTDKEGNLNCCKGAVTGNICEGNTVCTFSKSNSNKFEMCD